MAERKVNLFAKNIIRSYAKLSPFSRSIFTAFCVYTDAVKLKGYAKRLGTKCDLGSHAGTGRGALWHEDRHVRKDFRLLAQAPDQACYLWQERVVPLLSRVRCAEKV